MGIKYKLKLKDLKIEYLKEYFSPLLNYFKKTKKIENYSDLKEFIQKKSAWVSQVTLYGYLKTRMGAKYVLMFEDEIFLGSINKAKWNIYVVALQDLTFYTISYLKNERNLHDTEKSKEIFFQILDEELKNEIPKEIYDKAKNSFIERYKKLDGLQKDSKGNLKYNKIKYKLGKITTAKDKLQEDITLIKTRQGTWETSVKELQTSIRNSFKTNAATDLQNYLSNNNIGTTEISVIIDKITDGDELNQEEQDKYNKFRSTIKSNILLDITINRDITDETISKALKKYKSNLDINTKKYNIQSNKYDNTVKLQDKLYKMIQVDKVPLIAIFDFKLSYTDTDGNAQFVNPIFKYDTTNKKFIFEHIALTGNKASDTQIKTISLVKKQGKDIDNTLTKTDIDDFISTLSTKEFIDTTSKTINYKCQLFNILYSKSDKITDVTKKLNIYTSKHSNPYYISETDDYYDSYIATCHGDGLDLFVKKLCRESILDARYLHTKILCQR